MLHIQEKFKESKNLNLSSSGACLAIILVFAAQSKLTHTMVYAVSCFAVSMCMFLSLAIVCAYFAQKDKNLDELHRKTKGDKLLYLYINTSSLVFLAGVSLLIFNISLVAFYVFLLAAAIAVGFVFIQMVRYRKVSTGR